MELYEWIRQVLGLAIDPKELTFFQIGLRGLIVFICALMMVRVADKRFLSKMSALDAILGFLLASMLARAINGSASFFPTLAGGFVLVLAHRLFARAALRWQRFGELVKGREDVLVENGRMKEESMRSNNISRKDLFEELRLSGGVDDLSKVKKAVMERSGKISVVEQK